MNGKVDWAVFAFKFRDDPNDAFQRLAYHMFCRKFGRKEGISSFFNQKYIETDPIEYEGRKIGFQAKYYDTPSISSNQKSDLIAAIEGAVKTYPGINELYFYVTRSFSQSPVPGKSKTDSQIEIEKKGLELGVEITWILPTEFEEILQEKEYADVWEYFFTMNDDLRTAERNLDRYAAYITERYSKENSNCIYGKESLKDAYITPYLKRSSHPRQPVEAFIEEFVQKENRTAVIYGEPGHGKTSMCLRAAYRFYMEKWLQGSVSNVLYFSLNPTGTLAIDYTHKRFTFESLFSWGDDRSNESNIINAEACKGALVFFDGFDELIENIRSSTNGYFENLESFLEDYISGFAEKYEAHVIVTSRKMCIEAEFIDSKRNEKFIAGVPCFELDLMSSEDQDKWLEGYIERIKRKDEQLVTETISFIEDFKIHRKSKAVLKLTGVPIIFRMIIYNQFNERYVNTVDLYDKLFKKLLKENSRKLKGYAAKLEELAIRIYEGDDDSVQIEESSLMDSDTQYLEEWTYSFFTEHKTKRRIMFFHRSFYQYFLANHIYKLLTRASSEEQINELLVFLTRRKLDYETLHFIHERVGLSEKDLNGNIHRTIDHIEKNDAIIEQLYKAKWADEVIKIRMSANVIWNMVGVVAEVCQTFRYSQRFCDMISMYGNAGILVSADNGNSKIDFSERKLNNRSFFLGHLDGIRAESSEWMCSNFTKARMRNAVFTSAELADSVFRGANMLGIDLNEAILTNALFIGAKLRKAEMREAYLVGANLSKANLRYVDFTGADLTNANLEYANLENVILDGATLKGVKMKGAKLCGVSLSNIDLANADLTETVMRKVKIDHSIFTSVDFTGSDMRDSTIADSRFESVVLDKVNLSGATLRDVSFQNVNMRGATLNKTDLSKVRFNLGDLSGTNFRNGVITNTEFSLMYFMRTAFRKVTFTDIEVGISDVHNSLISYCEINNLKFYKADLVHVNFNKNTKDEITLESCGAKEVAFINMPTSNIRFDDTDTTGIEIKQTTEK